MSMTVHFGSVEVVQSLYTPVAPKSNCGLGVVKLKSNKVIFALLFIPLLRDEFTNIMLLLILISLVRLCPDPFTLARNLMIPSPESMKLILAPEPLKEQLSKNVSVIQMPL